MGKPYRPAPFNGTELWLNQCTTCKSANPSRPKEIPTSCSSCGLPLKTESTPNWMTNNRPQQITYGKLSRAKSDDGTPYQFEP